MNDDLESLTRKQLIAEAGKLRRDIRQHRDSNGHELCWHLPAPWSLRPGKTGGSDRARMVAVRA